MTITTVTATGVFPTDHTAIQAAVDAAADGDTIELKNKDGTTFFKMEGDNITVTADSGTNKLTATAHGLADGYIVYMTNVPEAAITVTADSATDKLVATAHGLSDDDRVQFSVSGGIAPAGLVTGFEYKVTAATANDFKVLRIPGDNVYPGGRPVDFTDNGTGALSVRRGSPPGGTENASFTIPNRLITGRQYYVVNSTANDFQLAKSSGGAAIDFDDDGWGTHGVKQMGFVNIGTESVPYTKSLTVKGKDVSGVKVTLEGGFNPINVVAPGKDFEFSRIRTLNSRGRCFRMTQFKDCTLDSCSAYAATGRDLTVDLRDTTLDLRLSAFEFGRTDSPVADNFTGQLVIKNCDADFEQDSSLDRELIKPGSWLKASDRAAQTGPTRRGTPGSWATVGIALWGAANTSVTHVINNKLLNMSTRAMFQDGCDGQMLVRDNIFSVGEYGVHRRGSGDACYALDIFPIALGRSGDVGEAVYQKNKILLNANAQVALSIWGSGAGQHKTLSFVQNHILGSNDKLHNYAAWIGDEKSSYFGQNTIKGHYNVCVYMGASGGGMSGNVFVGNNLDSALIDNWAYRLFGDTSNNTVLGGNAALAIKDTGTGNTITGVTPLTGGAGAALQDVLPDNIKPHRPDPWVD